MRAAIERTQTVKDESEQRRKGTLIGLLPGERRFEFREHPSQDVIHGKFSAKTQRTKEASFEAAFNKMGIATLRIRTFKRPWGSRTSYELLDFERDEHSPDVAAQLLASVDRSGGESK